MFLINSYIDFSVLIEGAVTIIFGLLVSKLGGNIVQMIGTFGSALSGPVAGLFLIGFFFPWANWKVCITCNCQVPWSTC